MTTVNGDPFAALNTSTTGAATTAKKADTLGQADLLRRAMGKKKPEEMAEHRKIFAEGAGKNGISQEKADELFDLIETFAGYGFNKSHAAAYALVAYHTAYFKAHHPAAFMRRHALGYIG